MKTKRVFKIAAGMTAICVGTLAVAQSHDHFDSRLTASAAITILDSGGQTVPNGLATTNSQTFNVTVGLNGQLNFKPGLVTILVGDTVKWTWASSSHSVTSASMCNAADDRFCSPSDTNCAAGTLSNGGAVYSHTFAQAGSYQYHCALHCNLGMIGGVRVLAPSFTIAAANPGAALSGVALPNVTVRIESSDDLVSGFAALTQKVTDDNGVFQHTDATALSKRFYRYLSP